MAMKGLRPLRVASFIRQELANILLIKAHNPLLREVVITHVTVTPDLKQARAFYRIIGEEPRDTYQKALDGASRYLEKSLGPVLRMPSIPHLTFLFDTQIEEEERVDHLFKKIDEESTGVDDV